MITLLSVVGDSDVRVNDTEVGEGTPLTSPFIEGIYGLGDRIFHQATQFLYLASSIEDHSCPRQLLRKESRGAAID